MDTNTLFTALGISLGLTLILEVGFFLILFYVARFTWNRTGTQQSPAISGRNTETGNFFFSAPWNKKDIFLVILVNTLTNPVVVLLYWILFYNTNINTIIIILPLEVVAVFTEGFIYKKNAHSIKRPFLFSLMANTFSYTTGLLIQQLF